MVRGGLVTQATALRERLKDGSWIIRHLPEVKLIVANFLTKIIAVKPSWERFWRFVNHQGSGTPREETRPVEEPAADITVNLGQDRPAPVSVDRHNAGMSHPSEPHLEKHQPEEGEHGRLTGMKGKPGHCPPVYFHSGTPHRNDRGISGTSRVQEKCSEDSLKALIQLFSKGSPEETGAVLDQWGLESLKPFMDKKNTPGQDGHPRQEGYEGFLK